MVPILVSQISKYRLNNIFSQLDLNLGTRQGTQKKVAQIEVK